MIRELIVFVKNIKIALLKSRTILSGMSGKAQDVLNTACAFCVEFN